MAEKRFYADAIRSIEDGSLASFFANGAELPSELVAYFGSFDLVVSFLFDPDHIFERNVKRCGVESFIVCNPKVGGGEHAALQLARPIEAAFATASAGSAAKIIPSDEDRRFACEFLSRAATPIIALHPGSGSAMKNWPIVNWQRVGEQLFERGFAGSLIVIGGEADAAAVKQLRSAWANQPARFAENLPLPQLAAVMASCTLFLGHDSGIAHIAAAAGAPCVLLFGPTDPAIWAPGNPNAFVLRAASGKMEDLSIEDVIATVANLLRARPTS